MMISPKYEVLHEIGHGGMGIVYKVRHTALDTVFALKILPAHLAEDPELIARFQREARVMAQLRHPNIVRVVDVDKAGDLHYFVMELIEGRSLARILTDEGKRPLPEVIDFGLQVARGIACAHGQHPAVIHRDLKPSNILIEDGSGRAVVTDFGLAKLAGGAESLRTESGKFIGTLRYCAPEQLTGAAAVDTRVDVYALGMVLYETYAGRSAYVDFERPQVVAGLLQLGLAHPFTFDPGTPEAFRRIVLQATAKDREQRHPSVAALLADLERLGASYARDPHDATLARGESAPGGRRSRRLLLGAAAGALGLAIASAVVLRGAAPRVLAPGDRAAATSDGPPAHGVAPIEKEPASIRRSVSVMDFSLASPDQQFAWMRDAIRDNLNSRLSAAPDCKVFSKEFIDFKAHQVVREGRQGDLKAAAMEVAQQLGVSQAILGSVRADQDTLHIEAHLVDMRTGVQEASETVEGRQAQFAELQARLAAKLMARLGVTPPPPEPPVEVGAEAGGDLESYRLLLQAEGRETAPAPPVAPPPVRDKARRGSLDGRPQALADAVGGWVRLVAPRAALALDAPADTAAAAEDAIRATLEEYRRACEQKDLAALADVYDHLSAAQVDANRRYFENARDLVVSFEEVDVAVGDTEAAVSYTRRDRFVDEGTRRPTKVDVRLTKILVLVDGHWKLSSGRPAR